MALAVERGHLSQLKKKPYKFEPGQVQNPLSRRGGGSVP